MICGQSTSRKGIYLSLKVEIQNSFQKNNLILIFGNETFLGMICEADFNIELFAAWFTFVEHSHMLRPSMISQGP